jgi:hypothetical protein
MPRFSYGVSLPVAVTLGRVIVGALLGAVIFGLPRWIITQIGIGAPPHPAYDPGEIWAGIVGLARWLITQFTSDPGRIWAAILAGRFPLLEYIAAGAIIGAASYTAWRAWLWALTRSEG